MEGQRGDVFSGLNRAVRELTCRDRGGKYALFFAVLKMSFAPVLRARDKRHGGIPWLEWIPSMRSKNSVFPAGEALGRPKFVSGISGGVRALCPSRGANGQTLGWGGQPYLEHEKCGGSKSSRRTGHHLGRGAPDIEAAARRIIQLARPVLPPLRRQWHLTGQLRAMPPS